MMDGTDASAGIRYPFDAPPEEGCVTQIAEGVLWARLPLPMALDHVNVYILDDGDGWTVFDTALDTMRNRGIWVKLLAGPLRGKQVKRVIVSHHHPDHVGLAGWFQAGGSSLWTTRTAWLFARMLTQDPQDTPPPEMLTFWRRAGMAPDLLDKRARERPFNFCDIVAPMPLGFKRICEGHVIRAGGRDWDVRLGQGHAPDQITLWSRDCPLVLGADQLLPSISPVLGVYATEPDADPVADWLDSCARLKEYARDDHLVLPGHKLPFAGLPLRLTQKIENHISALKRLEAHLATPKVASACFAPLFKRKVTEATYGLALSETLAHLNYLLARDRVARTLDDDGAWLWRATQMTD